MTRIFREITLCLCLVLFLGSVISTLPAPMKVHVANIGARP